MNTAQRNTALGAVYILQHVREDEDGSENVKFMGVYSSKTRAEAAIGRLADKPGFRDHLNGFHIDNYQIDKDDPGWAEGFGFED